MNRKKGTTFILIIVTVLLLMSVSFIKFNTFNCVKTSSRMFKILLGASVIEQVSYNPNIYISSPNNSMELLKEFMISEGFEFIPDERMSSTLTFKDNTRKIYVEFSLNRYYGTWKFTKD